MKKPIFILLLFVTNVFLGQTSDYILISSYNSSNEYFISKVDIKTCSHNKIYTIEDVIYDVAYDINDDKIYTSNDRFETHKIDTSNNFRILVSSSLAHNGLTFNSDSELFGSISNRIDLIDVINGTTKVLGRIDSVSLGNSAGDLTFYEERLFLMTDKGYIVEINLEDVSKSTLFAKTPLKTAFGISSLCNYGFYIYNENDIYKVSFENPEQIEMVCENITENPITGASSIYENIKNVEILGDILVCPNLKNYQLNASGFHSEYSWSTGETTQNITPKDTGTYWVKQTNYCGESIDSIHVSYRDLPKIKNLDSSAICFPLSINLASIPYSLEWYNQSKEKEISINKPGEYWLQLDDGHCKDTAYFTISKNEGTIEYPNTITPNQDSKNDFFQIIENENNPIELEVYNRWGALIYQNQDYQNDWPKEEISAGTYFYSTKIGECQEKSWLQVIK